MGKAIPVDLGPVQETLLIPLLGRAQETRLQRGLMHDPKAVSIVESLDYDFSKWLGTPSLVGASIRARIFDEQVSTFLSSHPSGTVVEIGAGLNTRFERLDNGKARWLELDLPDAMALRQQFFDSNERRTMLAADVRSSDWHEDVAALPGPYCFVSEAVLIYLDGTDVQHAIEPLAQRFPGSWLITDTVNSHAVENQHRHDAMKKLSKESWFRWKCDNPAGLRHWGLQLEQSQTFADVSPPIRAVMPTIYRFTLALLPWLARRLSRDYAINRYTFNDISPQQASV
ncbi:MAG: class I SAM-dependent methyltransferase [Pseudomonadota bacterium]